MSFSLGQTRVNYAFQPAQVTPGAIYASHSQLLFKMKPKSAAVFSLSVTCSQRG